MKEVNELKKCLKTLTSEMAISLQSLDIEMQKPESFERGKRIAKIWNKMKFDNDSALHFGLGVDLKKLDKFYQHSNKNNIDPPDRGSNICKSNLKRIS